MGIYAKQMLVHSKIESMSAAFAAYSDGKSDSSMPGMTFRAFL